MIKCFINANVIANYILIKRILRKTTKDKKDFMKEIKQRNSLSFYSFGLLEAIRMSAFSNLRFFSSQFTLGEISSVIIEQICLEEVNKIGIPLKFWSKMRKKYIETEASKEKISNDLYQELGEFHSIFIIERLISLVSDVDFYDNIKFLLQSFSEPDAYLLSQAEKNECNHFISNDKELKKFKKVLNAQELLSKTKVNDKMIIDWAIS